MLDIKTACDCMVVYENEPFREVMRRFLVYPSLRTVFVAALGGKFKGLMTRGDVMRVMSAGGDKPFELSTIELCNREPKFVFDKFDTEPSTIAETHDEVRGPHNFDPNTGIIDIPVVSDNNMLLGFVAMNNHYNADATYFKVDQGNGRLSQIPTIFFMELEKSAGTYITTMIEKNLGLCKIGFGDITEYGSLSCLHNPVFKGTVIHTHYFIDKFFNHKLNNFFPKVICHFRDIRQFVVASSYWRDIVASAPYHNGYLPLNLICEWQEKASIDEKIEHMLDNVLMKWIRWMSEMVVIMDSNPDNVLFTSFEEFVKDNEAFYKKILNFYEIPWSFWKGISIKKSMNSSLFRKGSVDEWRDVLSRDQIERINAMIPPDWFERFGWVR